MTGSETDPAASGGTGGWGGHVVACVALYVLALAVRLLFVTQTWEQLGYRAPVPGSDVDIYWRAAQHIREGLPWRPSFEVMMVSAPLYPLWLALGQGLFGDSIAVHRVLSALLFSATPVLLYAASWRVFGSRVAAIATGLMLALLPSLVFFNGMLLKVSLEVFLLALLLLAALSLRRGMSVAARIAWTGGVGGLLVLLFLSQQNTFLYAVVVLAYVGLARGLPRAQRLGLASGVLALVLAGAALFGAREQFFDVEQPLFLPQAGINVRIGHHERASAFFEIWRPVPATPYGVAFLSRLHAEVETGSSLSPAEANAWLLRDAARFSAQEPGRLVRRLVQKTLAFFNDFEPHGVQYFGHVAKSAPILRQLPVRYGALVVLAALGCVYVLTLSFAPRTAATSARPGPRAEQLFLLVGIVGAVLASNLLTFVTWRFRLPAVLPLAVLGGGGVALVWELFESGSDRTLSNREFGRTVAAVLGAGGLAAWLAFRPMASEQLVYELEMAAAHNEGEAVKAERALRVLAGSLAADRVTTDTDRARRAKLLVKAQRHSETFPVVRELALAGSSQTWVNQWCVAYWLWLGDWESAGDLLADLRRRDASLYKSVVQHPDPVVRRHLERVLLPRFGLPVPPADGSGR